MFSSDESLRIKIPLSCPHLNILSVPRETDYKGAIVELGDKEGIYGSKSCSRGCCQDSVSFGRRFVLALLDSLRNPFALNKVLLKDNYEPD